MRQKLNPPKTGLVLEIGSGDNPNPRSDVLVDRFLGQVIDPENRVLLGLFDLGSNGNGPVEPVSFEHRVYFISQGALKVFDDATFVPLDTHPISGLVGSPRSLVGTGGGRLAFRTTGDQLVLVQQVDTTPPAVSAPGGVTADATGPAGATCCMSAREPPNAASGTPPPAILPRVTRSGVIR